MADTQISIHSAFARRPDRVVADGYDREFAALRRVIRFSVLRRYARKPRPTGWLARWRWSRRINHDVDQAMAGLDNLPPSDALYTARMIGSNSDTTNVDRS